MLLAAVTGPAMGDLTAVQVKRRGCAARCCHWSGDAGPTCSAGEEALLCWSVDAGVSCSAGEEVALCCLPLSLVRRCGTDLQCR